MNDLFLHIGYPKTGTTTLQKLVFPSLSRASYFFDEKTPASAAFVGAFKRSPAIWRQYGQEIFSQFLAEAGGRPAVVSTATLTDQKIFAPRKKRVPSRDLYLLAAHLRECWATAKQFGFNRVRIVMGVRRQDQYLASSYATHGGRLADDPGQDDFERQVLEIIDREARYFVDGIWLDYKAARDLMVEAVGEDNVLVLPLEQLNQDGPTYFAALSDFLGEPLYNEQKWTNVRAVAPDVWRYIDRRVLKLRRRGRLGRYREAIHRLFAREFEIRLTPDLKSAVLAVYRDSNLRLADDLGLDLARYGYF